MSPTESENKQLVRRFVEDVFNEGRLDRIETYLAVGYTEHTTGAPEDIEGREAIREHYGGMQEAFPDFTVRIEELIAENDKVAQRSRQIGTHEGTFMDIPPTGETVDIGGMVIYRIEDGKIAESWVQADMMGLMQQLGVTES